MTWDATGDTLYVLGEADYLAKYRATAFTTRATFAGVADGSYILKSSFTDTNGITSTSTDRAFSVLMADVTPPVISSIASSTTVTTATITWTTNENATSTVEYGASSSYGSISSSAVLETSHSIVLTGLSSATAYHFRIGSTDAAGNRATTTDAVFTTAPDITAPGISSISSGTPGSTSASISWTTDEAASSRVEFGFTTAYGTTTITSDTSPRVTSHTVALTSLKSCTTYEFRVISADASGNTSTSTNSSLTTDGCVGGADVEASTATTATTATGTSTSLTSGGTTLSLVVPSGFAASDAVFQIKKIDGSEAIATAGSVSGKTAVTNLVYDLQAYKSDNTNITTFLNPLVITLAYGDSDISGIDESSLVIYRYDSGAWSALTNCSLNAGANTISCETTHFSTFAIFGNAAAAAPAISGSSSGGGSGGRMLLPLLQQQSVAAAVPAAAPAYVFARDLQLGDKGEDVRKLQQYLNRNGFAVALSGAGSAGSESDIFGNATRAALIKFQTAHAAEVLAPSGLRAATGYFGAFSRRYVMGTAAASAAPALPVPVRTSFSRNLSLGNTGEDVRSLQVFLNSRGFTIAPSGPGSPGNETNTFGNATKTALIRFQEAYRSEILAPNGFSKGTGTMGPATIAAILRIQNQ